MLTYWCNIGAYEMELSILAGKKIDRVEVALLEAALLDYIERFGLRPKARLALTKRIETYSNVVAFPTLCREQHRLDEMPNTNDV